jgi:hypothetical protein
MLRAFADFRAGRPTVGAAGCFLPPIQQPSSPPYFGLPPQHVPTRRDARPTCAILIRCPNVMFCYTADVRRLFAGLGAALPPDDYSANGESRTAARAYVRGEISVERKDGLTDGRTDAQISRTCRIDRRGSDKEETETRWRQREAVNAGGSAGLTGWGGGVTKRQEWKRRETD